MVRHVLLFLFLTVARLVSQAQTAPLDSAYLAQIDSIVQEYERRKQMEEVEKVIRTYEDLRLKKEMSFKTDGVLSLARGLLLTWTDHGFISQPALFEPKDPGTKWADYAVGGAPLAANWVLKAAGVKSRSSWERMLTANAMALGLSFGVTEVLKQTVRETRPDQSNRQAFSSGHASFAFVSATVLSREYGYLSPWVSVGGFATATATEMLRIRHNRHWMNDLYTGAGIGGMSTNLAYFLTDRFLGERHINKPEVRRKDVLRLMRFNEQPSGLALVVGTEIGNRKIDMGDAVLKTGASLSMGADLTCFTSSSVAVELMARMVDAQVKVFGTAPVFTGEHLGVYHMDVAAKLSAPIALGHRMGTRVFAGVRMLDGTSLTDGITTYTIPNEARMELGCGINYYCLDADNYAWGFTADYYHTFSHYMKNRYSISSVWKILF